jgi:putative membrane protein
MMSFILSPLINIVINGGILYVLTQTVEGIVYTGGFKFFVIGGIVLGFTNWIVKPILAIFALPLIFLSGGLILIATNIFVLWFLSYFLGVAEFREVTLVFQNTSSYVIGALVFGIINWVSNLILK